MKFYYFNNHFTTIMQGCYNSARLPTPCTNCYNLVTTLSQPYKVAARLLQPTVQLKGNLIPARVLQVEYCRVKITSCAQYLNGRPLCSYPHQANCRACAPANNTCEQYIILYELLNEHYNINSRYTMNLQILSLYVLIDP